MDEKVSAGKWPCTVEDKIVKPCKGLDRLIDGTSSSAARSKGFFYDTIMNLTTGKTTMTYIRMKLGEHQKKGIIANFCPMCGACISEHVHNMQKENDEHLRPV